MASIVADVAAERGVPVSVLMGRSRLKRDVRVRQEAIWRCREVRQDDGRPRYALQQIGQFFKRHHTTIIHACKRHLERTT
jgi:chromosomal replication initiation ATPase DnaA